MVAAPPHSQAGNITINLGYNVMKLGHDKMSAQAMAWAEGETDADGFPLGPEEAYALARSRGQLGSSWSNKTWTLGVVCMMLGNFMTFGSTAFAPVSLLAVLGSTQFVANVVFSSTILKEPVTLKLLCATGLIVAGCVLLILFGNRATEAYTVGALKALHGEATWVAYLCAAMGASIACYVFYRRGDWRSKMEGAAGRWWRSVTPVLFGLYAALVGTLTMVFSKSLSTLIRTTAEGDNQADSWFTWVMLLCFLFVSVFWVTRLNLGLRLFPAQVIVPIMQTFWTLLSVVAGIMYFREWVHFTALTYVMFPVGVLVVVGGIALLNPSPEAAKEFIGEYEPMPEEGGGAPPGPALAGGPEEGASQGRGAGAGAAGPGLEGGFSGIPEGGAAGEPEGPAPGTAESPASAAGGRGRATRLPPLRESADSLRTPVPPKYDLAHRAMAAAVAGPGAGTPSDGHGGGGLSPRASGSVGLPAGSVEGGFLASHRSPQRSAQRSALGSHGPRPDGSGRRAWMGRGASAADSAAPRQRYPVLVGSMHPAEPSDPEHPRASDRSGPEDKRGWLKRTAGKASTLGLRAIREAGQFLGIGSVLLGEASEDWTSVHARSPSGAHPHPHVQVHVLPALGASPAKFMDLLWWGVQAGVVGQPQRDRRLHPMPTAAEARRKQLAEEAKHFRLRAHMFGGGGYNAVLRQLEMAQAQAQSPPPPAGGGGGGPEGAGAPAAGAAARPPLRRRVTADFSPGFRAKASSMFVGGFGGALSRLLTGGRRDESPAGGGGSPAGGDLEKGGGGRPGGSPTRWGPGSPGDGPAALATHPSARQMTNLDPIPEGSRAGESDPDRSSGGGTRGGGGGGGGRHARTRSAAPVKSPGGAGAGGDALARDWSPEGAPGAGGSGKEAQSQELSGEEEKHRTLPATPPTAPHRGGRGGAPPPPVAPSGSSFVATASRAGPAPTATPPPPRSPPRAASFLPSPQLTPDGDTPLAPGSSRRSAGGSPSRDMSARRALTKTLPPGKLLPLLTGEGGGKALGAECSGALPELPPPRGGDAAEAPGAGPSPMSDPRAVVRSRSFAGIGHYEALLMDYMDDRKRALEDLQAPPSTRGGGGAGRWPPPASTARSSRRVSDEGRPRGAAARPSHESWRARAALGSLGPTASRRRDGTHGPAPSGEPSGLSVAGPPERVRLAPIPHPPHGHPLGAPGSGPLGHPRGHPHGHPHGHPLGHPHGPPGMGPRAYAGHPHYGRGAHPGAPPASSRLSVASSRHGHDAPGAGPPAGVLVGEQSEPQFRVTRPHRSKKERRKKRTSDSGVERGGEPPDAGAGGGGGGRAGPSEGGGFGGVIGLGEEASGAGGAAVGGGPRGAPAAGPGPAPSGEDRV